MPGPELKQSLRRLMYGAARLCSIPQAGARILTYHSVGTRSHEMNVSVDAFRTQMAWLREHARLVSLVESVNAGDGVSITFDDGYADNLLNAAPILTAFGIPATVFVVAGALGGYLPHDGASDDARILTRDELKRLYASGIGIGSHTMHHARLSSIPESEQREELSRSKTVLEEIIEAPVDTLAYPYGALLDYTSASMLLARECGYGLACSNRFGAHTANADRWAIRRVCIHANDDLSTFIAKVTGKLDALRWLESRGVAASKRAINRLLRV